MGVVQGTLEMLVLGSVAGILLLVCVLASLIPGIRATGVEPVEALSAE